MRHDHFAAGKSIQSEANIRLENGRTGRTRTERLRARDGAKHRDSERERAASLATLHVRTRERERESPPPIDFYPARCPFLLGRTQHGLSVSICLLVRF